MIGSHLDPILLGVRAPGSNLECESPSNEADIFEKAPRRGTN